MTKSKLCYSCGSDKVEKVENVFAITTGYAVPIETGYACNKCLKDKIIVRVNK